jgi:hypothetical protein
MVCLFILIGIIAGPGRKLTVTPNKTESESQPSKDDKNTQIVEPQKRIEVSLPVRGSKGVIEVENSGKEECFRKNLVDLAWDVSALLGEGALSSMGVECQSGKPIYSMIDAEVPRALRPTTLQEIPEKLLSVSRSVSTGFPQLKLHIIWVVTKEERTQRLGSYTHYPNEYEEFEFLGERLVKKGKRPVSGCQGVDEEKIIKIVAMRTGLKPFVWGSTNMMVLCNEQGELIILGLSLDIPLEKVPPPFIEENILPNFEAVFRRLGKAHRQNFVDVFKRQCQ